ncbi:hypothetical protein BCR41DRAFT_33538 [Lobosporangium transversale]|uniref:Uncharacterized protein n=1 Tax=Lobosporangium transversale TaxID=64571 RepID=A0A1Y2GSD8_9FUNG|nr:hypothetical protein BCR41DRAFT_33538 [Lobosporangium transversale]ORZ20011.1 hypothetical protein BCR41DRAFT_33538 [Lobosporangium transversale]|eukprot:XP_021882551.1 hypothetical protein BCR41DRAFT_33538 [Lobosporangium transversale]
MIYKTKKDRRRTYAQRDFPTLDNCSNCYMDIIQEAVLSIRQNWFINRFCR